jgi:hypothetical protein
MQGAISAVITKAMGAVITEDISEMNQKLQIIKIIQVPVWDEQVRQKVIGFWQGRGITFREVTDSLLSGHRGSFWGNLTSYDMSKLLADLTIRKTKANEISCQLDVDTCGQDITEWNKAYWQLELDTLESYLLYGDQKTEEWKQFLRNSRAAAWQWSLSLTWLGRKMP